MHNTSNPRDDATLSRARHQLCIHQAGSTLPIRLVASTNSAVNVHLVATTFASSGCGDNLRAERRCAERSPRIAAQLSPLLATSLHNPRQFVPHSRRSSDFYCRLRINKALSIRPRLFAQCTRDIVFLLSSRLRLSSEFMSETRALRAR